MTVFYRFIVPLLFLLTIASVTRAIDLQSVWERDGFAGPESAVFSNDGNTIYISNVNGSPEEADGNGFISKIAADGTLIERQWVNGLNAPKGMAINKNKQLFVADINTLVQIDIVSGKIVNRFTDETAKFLNDVTIDDQGRVFVSDMMTHKIHLLHDQKFTVWLESTALESPNGLLAQGRYLIVASWGKRADGFSTEVAGHMKSVDITSKQILSLGAAEPIGNLDGVEAFDEDFLVTDWILGKLFLIQRDGGVELLLQKEQGMADLGFNKDKKLIVLPMMMTGQVLAYTY